MWVISFLEDIVVISEGVEKYMALKTDVEVIIGGKVVTLSGYESEEYLQRIASYLNNKISEYMHVESYRRCSMDLQHTLLEINIADDFFKSKNQIIAMEEDLSQKEKDIYDLKHELVNNQMKTETIEKNLKAAQDKNAELERKLIELQAELKNAKRG